MVDQFGREGKEWWWLARKGRYWGGWLGRAGNGGGLVREWWGLVGEGRRWWTFG